jgi:MazG-like family
VRAYFLARLCQQRLKKHFQAGKSTFHAEQDSLEVSQLKRELDITHNLKVVEWLKADLVDTVGALMKSLMKAGSDATVDALANLIIIAYILGRRVGISFQVIEMRIKHKLNNSINDAPENEQFYGDLTQLQKYLEGKENKKR